MNRADYLPMTLEQLLKEVMRRFNGELPPVRDAGPCFTASFKFEGLEYYANGNTIRDTYTELLIVNDKKTARAVKRVNNARNRARKEAA